MNKQTFTTLFFARKAKEQKVVNGTTLKSKFADEASKAFSEYEKEEKSKAKVKATK